jgi:NAD(P)-dependent dehydrogenase (short-subunit alcohol dehydrogenase family)
MRGLKGKGVLISGGSRGIGRAAAQRFLEEEARVFLCGIDAEEVEETLHELRPQGRSEGAVCDVSREEDVARLVGEAERELRGIDILINNAGIAWQEAFLDITLEHWDLILATNLRGMFLVGQAVADRVPAPQAAAPLAGETGNRPGHRAGGLLVVHAPAAAVPGLETRGRSNTTRDARWGDGDALQRAQFRVPDGGGFHPAL